MAYWDTPMTKLEAVNVCLTSMGEQPINTLDGAAPDAMIASNIVDEQTRYVLNSGWHWNRETITLNPDVNGYIYLPSNTSRVRSIWGRKTADYVQRGDRLYDRINNTFVFTEPVEVEIYILLPFEDLVQQAKEYITASSAVLFQQRINGSESIDKSLKEREGRAWHMLLRAENNVGRPNSLRDNWSSASVVNRGAFVRGDVYNWWRY